MSKNTATIPLEDEICDVIGKAMRGHGFKPESLAKRCGLGVETIQQSLNEAAPPVLTTQLESIAHILGLSTAALTGLPSYKPSTTPPEELKLIVTPFGHAGVNAVILRHGSHATLFDTGTDATPILQYLKQESLTLDAIYITHRHHDHVGALSDLPKTPTFFAEDLSHGETKRLAHGIQLTALESSGHFTPSRAYLIDGLALPVCICGDIIFAGSMGKAPDPAHYQQSIDHARDHILSLPSNTLLYPGHGPLTSVGQEIRHNPFWANT